MKKFMQWKLKWPDFNLMFETYNVESKFIYFDGFQYYFSSVYIPKVQTWSWIFQSFEIYNEILGV